MIAGLRHRLRRRRPPTMGVNLVGYFRAESGVGEIARLYLAALDAAEIPVAIVPFDRTRNRQEHPLPLGAPSEPIHDVNLLCINADQLPVFAAEHGASTLAGRYNIGVWAWEVEEFPDPMARSADLVDEIWGISSFTADAIRSKVRKPVLAMPLPIDPTPPLPLTRSELGLPAGFLVLSCYDFESVFERKNPLGSLAAFRTAFPTPGEATLVLKSVNGHFHPDQLARVRAAAADRSDVLVLDGYLARGRQSALIAACDVFLSLHRAEGFGLMIAEALALGRSVVATGYGGPMDFLDGERDRLVRWTSAAVPTGAGPYGGSWAEPDLDHAASFLRERRASFTPGAASRLAIPSALSASVQLDARSNAIRDRLDRCSAEPPPDRGIRTVEARREVARRQREEGRLRRRHRIEASTSARRPFATGDREPE